MTSKSPTHKTAIRLNLLVAALLGAIFAQAIGSAARTSITIDEGLHITSGYAILRTGDFRLVEEHPPLVKMWEALPLLPVPDLPNPAALPGWESNVSVTDSVRLVRAAQALIYPYQPIDRLVFPARVQSALLAVLLGAVVFRWAQDLWGWKSGLLALFLLTFDPNILAHASVSGTDLGAACFITLALFTLSRFLRRPTFLRLAFAGVTLGLAQGAKLSALVLLPVVALLVLFGLQRRRLLALALIFFVAGLTLWAIYGFEIGPVPGVPFPVPAASHAIPWLRLRQHMAGGHSAFLLGENSTRGWWYYFPVAFGLKTPLPTLALLAAASLQVRKRQVRKWGSEQVSREGALLLFPLLYGVSSLFSPLNIGYRHLLPILPFLFIFTSRIANGEWRMANGVLRITHYALRITHYALLFWLSFATLRIFPHYLAYFNELAGGPDGGYRYLADSNTDWGQAYKDLAQFQREHNLGPVRLSAFIFYDPAIYGVEYEPLTPMRGDTPAVFPSRFSPPPGEYVISATTLDGIPLADPEMYDWFRRREPDAKIGHVLFYYHIPKREPAPTWLAQCTAPAAPLSLPVAAEGFGRDGLRLVYFDCVQSWLYPTGGQSPGWYALHRQEATSGNEFINQRLSPARLSFEQKIPHETPPLTVFEWDGQAPVPGSVQAWAAPAEWLPEQVEREGVPISAPVALDGPLMFLGYETQQEGQTVTLLTYWQVTERPARPFSLMGHLLGADGVPVAVGDGLGVPWDQLQPGDVLVQRHTLAAPAGTYWLQTGAYWLDTMERWGIKGGDSLLLAAVEETQ